MLLLTQEQELNFENQQPTDELDKPKLLENLKNIKNSLLLNTITGVQT